MHRKSLTEGHQSILLVRGDYFKQDEGVIPLYSRTHHRLKKLSGFFYKTHKTVPKYYFYNINEQKNLVDPNFIIKRIGMTPDAIIVYWISRFLNFESLLRLQEYSRAKIYFSLTDMALYTGGCHYAWSCEGFKNDCSHCPALPEPLTDRAHKNLMAKKRALDKMDHKVIATKGQSIKMSKSSSLFGKSDHLANLYKIGKGSINRSQKKARTHFGLPLNKKIWLIGTERLSDPRKGIDILIESMRNLVNILSPTDLPMLMIIGNKRVSWLDDVQLPYKFLGRLDFDDELPLAFSAADAFLSPSVMDTGPFMVNLSIYYSCPVVSFPVGVAQYLIGEMGCGLLAEQTNAKSYTEALHRLALLSDQQFQHLRQACMQVANQELRWMENTLTELLSN